MQFDTVKLTPGVFQFTAIDDGTRLRVLSLAKRQTAEPAADFLEEPAKRSIRCVRHGLEVCAVRRHGRDP